MESRLDGESLDTVWIEAMPVIPAREEDDGDTGVAEILDSLSGLRVSRDIPLHELNVQVIQALLSEPAGVARRGRKHSNQEETPFKKGLTSILSEGAE